MDDILKKLALVSLLGAAAVPAYAVDNTLRQLPPAAAAIGAPAPKNDPKLYHMPSLDAGLREASIPFEKTLDESNLIYAGLQIADFKFAMIPYDCDKDHLHCRSVELRAGFTDHGRAPRAQRLESANRYAMEHRWIRTFVDSDNNIILECDIGGSGCGADPKDVVAVITGTWLRALAGFSAH